MRSFVHKCWFEFRALVFLLYSSMLEEPSYTTKGLKLEKLPIDDFDLRASHARTLLPAALASVSLGFIKVRVRKAPTLGTRPLSATR